MDHIKYQIFISSTYKDLELARDNIIETILKLYHFPVGTVLWGQVFILDKKLDLSRMKT